MARPRSEDKQIALLEAATNVVAERGLGAPTSEIARKAGVAEGTLFRYFPSKEDLLNKLYLHIKASMCERLCANYLETAAFDKRVQSLWNTYIDWGLANPVANKAIHQLAVSDVVWQETRMTAKRLFPKIGLSEKFAANKAFTGCPGGFSDAIFLALADATMACAAREPQHREVYKASGFTALWTMVGVSLD